MKLREQIELLKATLVLAAADGEIRHSERGLYERLARRIGVGRASIDAMIDQARDTHEALEEICGTAIADPQRAFKLLVAAARLDGEISEEEREVLVLMMPKLKLSPDKFTELYEEGLALADDLRKRNAGW